MESLWWGSRLVQPSTVMGFITQQALNWRYCGSGGRGPATAEWFTSYSMGWSPYGESPSKSGCCFLLSTAVFSVMKMKPVGKHGKENVHCLAPCFPYPVSRCRCPWDVPKASATDITQLWNEHKQKKIARWPQVFLLVIGHERENSFIRPGWICHFYWANCKLTDFTLWKSFEWS